MRTVISPLWLYHWRCHGLSPCLRKPSALIGRDLVVLGPCVAEMIRIARVQSVADLFHLVLLQPVEGSLEVIKD